MPARLERMAGLCSGSLSRPSKSAEPAWDDFPEGLRKDLDDYFAGLAKPHRSLGGKRIQPCSPERSRYRRAELVAMARMAVRLGVPIESLTSLAALLHPDVVELVIDAYWQKNGEEPKTCTIDLGKKVLRMARETGCLDQAALDRLDDMRVALEHHRREGLTPKNLQLVRQVLTDGVWSEVVALPNVLMQQARSAKDHAPIKAAISAQLAVAVAILTFAPVRLSNLVSIELGENLIKPGGLNTPYWLVFPHYDVKNRVDLNFQFDQPLTDLIDEYIHEFRPALLRGANASWLFPGEGGQPKTRLHVQQADYCAHSESDRTSDHGSSIPPRRGGDLSQAPARGLRDRTAAAWTSRYPDDSSLLLRPADHGGHRAVRKAHPSADQVRCC